MKYEEKGVFVTKKIFAQILPHTNNFHTIYTGPFINSNIKMSFWTRCHIISIIFCLQENHDQHQNLGLSNFDIKFLMFGQIHLMYLSKGIFYTR